MTCKDCLHVEVCKKYASLQEFEKKAGEDGAEKCSCFADKSQYIKLPCKVGDEVWRIAYPPHITKDRCLGITSTEHDKWAIYLSGRSIDLSEFDKTVFLTREEAEKALEDRK